MTRGGNHSCSDIIWCWPRTDHWESASWWKAASLGNCLGTLFFQCRCQPEREFRAGLWWHNATWECRSHRALQWFPVAGPFSDLSVPFSTDRLPFEGPWFVCLDKERPVDIIPCSFDYMLCIMMTSTDAYIEHTQEEFVNSRPSLEIFQYVCMHGLSLIPLTGGVPGTSTQYQKVP